MKKAFVLLVLVLALLPVSAWAAVAKVGDTEYDSIDDAVSVWMKMAKSTMTLLDDVTLSDVITLKSTENHTLDLGTYTMTAAVGKHAIQITCNGSSNASSCLTINADPENPGGITAAGKSCIYYQKRVSTKDRPIITINGGVYNGSYAINSSSSNKGTNCPQFWINGGIFKGNVNLNNAMLRNAGGTFEGWINCKGDSSAYRLIWGGEFREFQFMTADNDNTKFWIGKSMATSDVGVYIDDQGYLVVGGSVIKEREDRFEAYASSDNFKNYRQNNEFQYYLKYSSANDYGRYFTDAEMALAKSSQAKDKVTVYVDKLNLIGVNYKGTIVLPISENELKEKKVKVLTTDYKEGANPNWSVTVEPALDPDKKALIYEDSEANNGIVTRTYYVCDAVPGTTITDKAAAYSIIHYQQMLDGSYAEVTTDTQFPLFAKVGETVFAAVKDYAGYAFNAEKSNVSDETAMPEMVDGELEITKLELYYDLNSYQIIFDTAGGSAVAAIEKKYGADVNMPADPTKEGYTFGGWKDENDRSVVFPMEMPLDGLTLMAAWNPVTYEISYNLNGGKTDGMNPVNYTIENSGITLINPTKEGYTFQGWTGTGLEEKTMTVTIPKGSLGVRSYTANWTPNITQITDKVAAFSVAHYQQMLDGSYSEVTADTQFPLFAKVGEIVSAQDESYEGYHLNTEKTKASAVLTMPQTVEGKLEVTKLELYYDLNSYRIVFDTDGGTALATIEKKYGETVQAPADPTRNGYTFLGWQDAKGNAVTFPLNMPLDGQTIKAKWMSNEQILIRTIINKEFENMDIPEELQKQGLNTVEKINAVLQTKAETLVSDSLSTQLHDVELVYSVDGGKTWVEADEEHFPEDGKLWITLPIPEGTDPLTHEYRVIHMFTTDAFGKVPGETEEPQVSIVYDENGAPKLGFYVTGLSPIMVTWRMKGVVIDLPKTGDNSLLVQWLVFMGMAGAAMLLLRKRVHG